MAIAPEVQSWIDDLVKAGLTKEDLAGVLTKAEANEGIANALKGSVMAQRDYSRQVQELSKKQKEAQDEAARSAAYVQELSKWKTEQVDPVVQRANESYAEYQRRLAALQGIDAEPTAAQPAAAAAKPRDPETGKFITADDFQKQAQEFGRNMPLVNAKMLKLQQRHSKLYHGVADAPEFDPEALIQHAYDNKQTMEAAAEALYKFTDRQEALHQADIQRRIDEGIKDGVSKRLSEMAVAGPTGQVRAPGHTVPALDVGARPKMADSTGDGKQPYTQAADTPARMHDRISRFTDKLNNELYGGNG